MKTPGNDVTFAGAIPEQYERLLGPVLFTPYGKDLADRVAAVVKQGAVLETACGTGLVTRLLDERLPESVHIVATDLNEPMLEVARATLRSTKRITWRQADATALPFDRASFDAVVCQFGMMFMPDKALAVREARRVLKPGGLFAFNVWAGLSDNPASFLAHETIAAFFPKNPPQFYHTPFGWNDVRELERVMTGNGFGQVSVQRKSMVGESKSARDYATGLVRGTPVSVAIAELGGDFDRIVTAVTAGLARLGGDSPHRSPMVALVVTGLAA